MNHTMAKEYNKLSLENLQLNKKLRKLAVAGFIKKDGCYLLKKLSRRGTNVTRATLTHNWQFERWINETYLGDYVEENLLEQGVLFVKEIFGVWNLYNESAPLIAMLSIDNGCMLEDYIKGVTKPSVTITFHMKPIDEEDIIGCNELIDYDQLCDSDLLDEDDKQPALIVDSYDVDFANFKISMGIV